MKYFLVVAVLLSGCSRPVEKATRNRRDIGFTSRTRFPAI